MAKSVQVGSFGENMRFMLRAFRGRNYVLFFMGQGLSLIGTWMQNTALPLLAYQMRGQTSDLGMVGFFSAIPGFLIGPFAGVFSDRWNRRKVLMVTQALSLVQAAVLAALTLSGTIQIWHVMALGAFLGMIGAFDIPTRQSFVVQMVEDKEHLPNAIALNSMVNNMARVVGPGIAGFMISYSISSAYFGEFLFFTAATQTLFRLRLNQQAPPRREPVLKGVRLGFRYVLEHRTLLRLTLLQAIPSFLIYPYIQMVPNIAKNYLHVGAGGYGWLQTGVGIGSLVSALVVASFANVERKGAIASIALLAYMSMILAFSFSRTYVLSLFALIFAGMGLVVFSTFNQTLLQLNVEDEFRGRVLSLYTMSQGLNPFGSLLMGFIAEKYLGAPHAIALFCGVALVLTFVSGIASKEVRSL